MENRKEQKEALETLVEFNERLVKNMHIIVKELSGNRLEDTDKFLKAIVDAMNWEIAVMNGTMTLGKQRVDKDTFNKKVLEFGTAINSKNDVAMADAITQLIPEFENLGNAAKEVIA